MPRREIIISSGLHNFGYWSHDSMSKSMLWNHTVLKMVDFWNGQDLPPQWSAEAEEWSSSSSCCRKAITLMHHHLSPLSLSVRGPPLLNAAFTAMMSGGGRGEKWNAGSDVQRKERICHRLKVAVPIKDESPAADIFPRFERIYWRWFCKLNIDGRQSHFRFWVLIKAGNDIARHLQESSECNSNGELRRESPLDCHFRGPANNSSRNIPWVQVFAANSFWTATLNPDRKIFWLLSCQVHQKPAFVFTQPCDGPLNSIFPPWQPSTPPRIPGYKRSREIEGQRGGGLKRWEDGVEWTFFGVIEQTTRRSC